MELFMVHALEGYPALMDAAVWLAVGGLVAGIAAWVSPKVRLPRAVCRLGIAACLGGLVQASRPLFGRMLAPADLEHWIGRPGFGPVGMALGTVGGWAAWRAHARSHRARGWVWGWAAGALTVGLGLPYAAMAPWAPDEAFYHLSLPIYRLITGHLAPLGHGNGGFFNLGEGLVELALVMGSVTAARGMQIYAALWGGQAFAALWPTVSARRAALAQALFVLSPVVLWQLGCAYVDIFQAAYALAAAGLLARFEQAPQRRRFLWAGALMVGCAAGCKVTALALMPCIGLIVLWRLGRRGLPLALGATLTGCLPWAGYAWRNLQHYGAPLYPFGPVLGPSHEALLPTQASTLYDFLSLHGPVLDGALVQGWQRWAALPYALILGAKFASPAFDGVVGCVPVLALLAVLTRLGRRHPAPAASWGLYGLIVMLGGVWLGTSWQARFLIGPLWAMAWLVALEAPPWPTASRGRALYGLALGGAATALCLGLLTVRGHMPPLSASVALRDRAARTALRAQRIPASPLCDAWPHTEPRRIMLVWAQRLSLFCLGPQVSDSYDEGARLKAALGASQDPQAVEAQLRLWGITHLIVNLERTHDDFTPAEWAAWQAFAHRTLHALAQQGPVVLFGWQRDQAGS